MTRLDLTLRVAAALACLSLAVAALAMGWAATTRTTQAGPGVIYRQNLITGSAAFCGPDGCIEGPRTTRPAVDAEALDFSSQVTPGPGR